MDKVALAKLACDLSLLKVVDSIAEKVYRLPLNRLVLTDVD
jgi:hypothetical protein